MNSEPVIVLMADDDPDDQQWAQEAFHVGRVANPLRFVNDGEELLAYLRREGEYADAAKHPMPGLILLDLNMPRMDGREALREIRADPTLRHIPVVVLTTSQEAAEVMGSYRSGANSFITKPVTLEALVEVIRSMDRYWLQIVELPRAPRP